MQGAVQSKTTTIFFIVLCTLLYTIALCGDAAGSKTDIMVVHSYDPEYLWTQRINEGIRDALAGHGTIDKIIYMDAKRLPSPEHLNHVAQEALQFIKENDPHIVICVDDVAQQYLAAKYLKGQNSPQVVFCGVNAPLEKYGYPAANVSGIRERWHFRDAFALMKKILPEAQTVAFLVEDSESGGYVLHDLLEELQQDGPYALTLAGVEKIQTFKQWQHRILYYSKNADVLALGLYNSILDEKTGKVASPDKIMAWTNATMNNPTLGFSDIAVQHGILCGILESGHEQGYLAGKMARTIIEKDIQAGELPVGINDKGIVFLNLRTAEQLNIQIPYRFIEAAGEVIK